MWELCRCNLRKSIELNSEPNLNESQKEQWHDEIAKQRREGDEKTEEFTEAEGW